MVSAEFLFKNPNSADPFYAHNMRYGICRQCENTLHCNKSEMMPVISPMSSYVMKYDSEIKSGFAVYPEAGGWEQQPIWFTSLLASFRSKIAELQQAELNKNG